MARRVNNGAAEVTTTIIKSDLMSALRELTINNECFDGARWAPYDAECLEAAARMIREHYARTKGTIPCDDGSASSPAAASPPSTPMA